MRISSKYNPRRKVAKTKQHDSSRHFYDIIVVGDREEILVEGISSKYNNMVTGRTKNNKLITIPGNKNLIGKIIDIKITELNNRSLKGEIINI